MTALSTPLWHLFVQDVVQNQNKLFVIDGAGLQHVDS